jgi:hypothetical protein
MRANNREYFSELLTFSSSVARNIGLPGGRSDSAPGFTGELLLYQ